MGEPVLSGAPKLFISIADGPDIGWNYDHFEWKSFTNGGYVVRAKLRDPYWKVLRDFATKQYLVQGRRQPTKIIWEISWPGNESTGKHMGYIVDMDARGINAGGTLEFVAVDPPSYWLNAGDSSGKYYEGSVKEVIEQVLREYFIGPNGNVGRYEVSDTLDNIKNKWWMMRMDPKTFIRSLLDWSSSITGQKTNWIVSSGGSIDDEPTIWIKEQALRKSVDYGIYTLNAKAPRLDDVKKFELLTDNFISVFQRQIITQGISAVSERFFDRKTDQSRKNVHVYDENTSNKKNVSIDQNKGFTKPGVPPAAIEKPHEWSTSIIAVPQFSGGELGVAYDKYIDGRARGLFLNMLNLVMRIKLRVNGEPSKLLADSHNLGVSKLKVVWFDTDHKPYFLHGDWLVYGFHHVVEVGNWYTDLYCARLDFDSVAQKV